MLLEDELPFRILSYQFCIMLYTFRIPSYPFRIMLYTFRIQSHPFRIMLNTFRIGVSYIYLQSVLGLHGIIQAV